MSYKDLKQKIITRRARIAIIGIGYVGLPLAISFSKKKYKGIIGIEKNKFIIKLLKSNKSHLSHISDNEVSKLKANFEITNKMKELTNVDIIIICLPTPLGKNLSPDMSFISKCIKEIKKFLKPNQLLILESTVYPGATNDVIIKKLKSKFKIGENFYIGYSPEREDPGNKNSNSSLMTKLVSGETKNCLELTKILYKSVFKKIWPLSNIKTCEMTKLYENIYRSVNIGMANEMKIICNGLNMNIYEVIEAAKTKPFGFNAFYPGPGLGGHCIPIDPLFLTWVAKKNKIDTKFISLSNKINRQMPIYIYKKFLKFKKKIKNYKILIVGLSYKKNIDDTRESPAIKFIDFLIKDGIKFEYYDPYIKKYKFNSKIIKSSNLNSIKKSNNYISILMTDHDKIDFEFLKNHSKYIIDTRGRYKLDGEKIVPL
jgi:UDP-N-acetyl-D-glucosamine dehydrogenase|tara:strand:+ start:217 stop:1500 length:1284 start_codon:yes stop_codon:yes gene_type:complete